MQRFPLKVDRREQVPPPKSPLSDPSAAPACLCKKRQCDPRAIAALDPNLLHPNGRSSRPGPSPPQTAFSNRLTPGAAARAPHQPFRPPTTALAPSA
uniref:Uncharacterized protein n=1 Tax=Mycena chlorophos TaxID=658473 RepID=A0ABQ0L383_MYCCL|nr:predicted protein [Mycena chlorophos]